MCSFPSSAYAWIISPAKRTFLILRVLLCQVLCLFMCTDSCGICSRYLFKAINIPSDTIAPKRAPEPEHVEEREGCPCLGFKCSKLYSLRDWLFGSRLPVNPAAVLLSNLMQTKQKGAVCCVEQLGKTDL